MGFNADRDGDNHVFDPSNFENPVQGRTTLIGPHASVDRVDRWWDSNIKVGLLVYSPLQAEVADGRIHQLIQHRREYLRIQRCAR